MSRVAPAFARLLQLIAGLPLIIGLSVFFILSTDFSHRSKEQQRQYGEATAAQLSDFLAAYVMADDILSLNVITARISDRDQVISIAVFDDTDRMLAQSGRPSLAGTTFSSEITFQDSVIGYVRVTVPDTPVANQILLLIPVLLMGGILILGWFRSDLIIAWLNPLPSEESDALPTGGSDSQLASAETVATGPECFLVIRIRPAHHLARHFDRFFSAASRFTGIVEQTTREELVIHFNEGQGMYAAATTGLLIRRLSEILQGNMSFGGTLDIVGDDPDEHRKAASYLASIAEGDLLIAGGESFLADRATLQTFHHPMVDSADLRRVVEVEDQEQLMQQAESLAKQ